MVSNDSVYDWANLVDVLRSLTNVDNQSKDLEYSALMPEMYRINLWISQQSPEFFQSYIYKHKILSLLKCFDTLCKNSKSSIASYLAHGMLYIAIEIQQIHIIRV